MKDTDPGKPKELKMGGWSAHYVLIVCTLLYAINYIDRQVFSVVVQPMKLELHLTDFECGLALSICLLGMALFSFPIAHMVDRWSRKKSMSIMAILWSGFTFATGLATSFIGVIIPRAFVGVGEAGFVPGGTAMVGASYSRQNRGKALGIFHIAIPLGAAVGVILGGYISVHYGWRTPFLIFAIPGIILGIMALFMKDYKTAEPTGTETGIKGFYAALGHMFRIPTVRWFYPALGLSVFMSMAVLNWMPALVMRMLNVNENFAGNLVGGVGLAAIIGAPLGGFLSDYWSKKSPRGRMYVPAIANLIGAVLIVIVILTKFNTIGIAIAVLYGIAVSMAVPGFAIVSQDIVPVAHKGLSMGLVVFAQYLLGGAWGPGVIGAVSDALGGGADGLGMAVMLSAIVGFAGGLCFIMASRTYPADADKVKHDVIMAES
jgi:MFS family permease